MRNGFFRNLLRVWMAGMIVMSSACASAEKEKAGEFIVISSAGKPNTDCKIISKGNMYAAIYRKSYGPASFKECETWVKKNCK
jgi:hypothetical protein